MTSRSTLVMMILVLLALLSLARPAVAAPVVVTVSQNGVQINMNLLFTENITTLPRFYIHIDSSNSSRTMATLHDPFQTAIAKLVPSARVDLIALSAGTSNSSTTWRLTENFTINLSGVGKNYGSSISTDTSFPAFNVTGPLIISGNELNYVPKAYVLDNLTATGQSSTTKYYYYINGHRTLTPSIPSITTNVFHLLDFTWVLALSAWQESQTILGRSTTWSYQLSGPRYNLTYGSPTPEGTLIQAFEAVYSPSIQLNVPAVAWLEGQNLRFDTPAPAETLMPLVVLASIAALAVTLVFDRRLRPTNVKKRERKSKKSQTG